MLFLQETNFCEYVKIPNSATFDNRKASMTLYYVVLCGDSGKTYYTSTDHYIME